MKFTDLYEGDVISLNKDEADDGGMPIPKGFESFYVKKKGRNVGAIIGVRKDGTEKLISTSTLDGAEMLAKHYNSGGRAGLKKLSFGEAFGTEETRILEKMNIKFAEKPHDFESIRKPKYSISELSFRRIQKAFEEAGLKKIKEHRAKEVFGEDFEDMPEGGPMKDAHFSEPVMVIHFKNSGHRYLVDTTGAKKYIRFWAYLK